MHARFKVRGIINIKKKMQMVKSQLFLFYQLSSRYGIDSSISFFNICLPLVSSVRRLKKYQTGIVQ